MHSVRGQTSVPVSRNQPYPSNHLSAFGRPCLAPSSELSLAGGRSGTGGAVVRGSSRGQMRTGSAPDQPAHFTHPRPDSDTVKRSDDLPVGELGGLDGIGKVGVRGKIDLLDGGGVARSPPASVASTSDPTFNSIRTIPSSNSTIAHHRLRSSGTISYLAIERASLCPLGSYSSLSPFATPRPASPAPNPTHPTFPIPPRREPTRPARTSYLQLDCDDPLDSTNEPESPSPSRHRGRSLTIRSQSASPTPRISAHPAERASSFISPIGTIAAPVHTVFHQPRHPPPSPSPSASSPTCGGPAGRRTTFAPSTLSELQLAWDRGEYYPTGESGEGMMERSGLTRTQVRGWFANRRQRVKDEERAAVAEEARRVGVPGVVG